jgi:hypothetical protein
MSQRYKAVPLSVCLLYVHLVGVVTENQHPSIRSRTVEGLMTRGAVMKESFCTFIGYQVRVKLVVIRSYPTVVLTPGLTIQFTFA